MSKLSDLPNEVLRLVISHFPPGGYDWVHFALALGKDRSDGVASCNDAWHRELERRYPRAARTPLKYIAFSSDNPTTELDGTQDYPWGTFLCSIQQAMFSRGSMADAIARAGPDIFLQTPPPRIGHVVDLRMFVTATEQEEYHKERSEVVSLVPRYSAADEQRAADATYSVRDRAMHALLSKLNGMERVAAEEAPMETLSATTPKDVDLFLLGVDIDLVSDPQDDGSVDRSGRTEAREELAAQGLVSRALGDVLGSAVAPSKGSTEFVSHASMGGTSTVRFIHRVLRAAGGVTIQAYAPCSVYANQREIEVRFLIQNGRKLQRDVEKKKGFFSRLFDAGSTTPIKKVPDSECLLLVVRGSDALEAVDGTEVGSHISRIAKSHLEDLLNRFVCSPPTTVNALSSAASSAASLQSMNLMIVVLWDSAAPNSLREGNEVDDVLQVNKWVLGHLLKPICGPTQSPFHRAIVAAGPPSQQDFSTASPKGFPFVQIRHVSRRSRHSVLSLCESIYS